MTDASRLLIGTVGNHEISEPAGGVEGTWEEALRPTHPGLVLSAASWTLPQSVPSILGLLPFCLVL